MKDRAHTAIHKGEGKRGGSLGETEADRPVVRQGWGTRAVPWVVWMPHCHEGGERGTALWNLLPRRFLWFLVTRPLPPLPLHLHINPELQGVQTVLPLSPKALIQFNPISLVQKGQNV